MRKAFTALLAFMLVVTGPMTFRHPARAELAPQSAIAAYLAHYGYKLPDFTQNRPNSTQVIDCEEVMVILTDITWDETSNMSPILRAAVRIYAAPGEYASSTFVYSSQSSAYHPYNSGYGNGLRDTYIAGRVDNRDSGTLDVSGTFHN